MIGCRLYVTELDQTEVGGVFYGPHVEHPHVN